MFGYCQNETEPQTGCRSMLASRSVWCVSLRLIKCSRCSGKNPPGSSPCYLIQNQHSYSSCHIPPVLCWRSSPPGIKILCQLRKSWRSTPSNRCLHSHSGQTQLPSTWELKGKQFTQVGKVQLCGKVTEKAMAANRAPMHIPLLGPKRTGTGKFVLQSEDLS